MKSTWYSRNRGKAYENMRAWQKANKEKHRAYVKAWEQANLGKRNAITAKRKAIKLKATPPWLNAAQKAEIDGIYHFSEIMGQITGIEHHVDHIFPLQGKGFTGLHVPWNLEVIPAYDNKLKHNKFPEQYADLAWS